MERTRRLMVLVFVLAVGTAFGLAGPAQAQNIILTFSDLEPISAGGPPVPEDYQPSELQGTGVTMTWTGWYMYNEDEFGKGLGDHTETWDAGAPPVWIYVVDDGGSIEFSRAVEVPSIWINQDSWAESEVAGYSGDQEVWSVPAEHPEAWVEITEGAGQWIDTIVVVGGLSRFDDITITLGSPHHATNPRPGNGAINVDPVLALLEWDAPTEPCKVTPLYDVYFGTDPDVANNPKILSLGAATSVDPTPVGDLAIDTEYYWRVDVNDCSIYDIIAIEDLGGGVVRAITAAHGGNIVAGNSVTITDTSDYNGTHLVTNVPEPNQFDFVDAFTSSQTGKVEVDVTRTGSIWTFRTWPWEPLILTQPENFMAPPDGTATFTVVSGGNVGGGHTYQWYHYVNPGDANQVIAGATSSTLSVTNCQYNDDPLLNDEGFYLCQVKNTPSGGPTDTTNSDLAGLMILRLMARYPFNGNAIDDVSQYDAVVHNHEGYSAGIEGFAAIRLKGDDSYLYVPYILAEAIGRFEDYTIAAWVNPDPGEDEAVIWAGYDDTVEETAGGLSGGEGFSIERQADGTVFVRVEGNDPETISVAGAIPEDQWTHVVFVYDSNDNVGTGTVYINGEQAEQVEYDIGNAQQMGSFSLGAYRPDGGSPRWFLDGYLDDVRFYAYPISAVNVASLYNEITSDPVCTGVPGADLNDGCTVELVDYAKMLSNYLGCNIVPALGNCP